MELGRVTFESRSRCPGPSRTYPALWPPAHKKLHISPTWVPPRQEHQCDVSASSEKGAWLSPRLGSQQEKDVETGGSAPAIFEQRLNSSLGRVGSGRVDSPRRRRCSPCFPKRRWRGSLWGWEADPGEQFDIFSARSRPGGCRRSRRTHPDLRHAPRRRVGVEHVDLVVPTPTPEQRVSDQGLKGKREVNRAHGGALPPE